MLLFLGNTIEQLDLALEHVRKGDPNNARFGLMLIDNVVELNLHRLAKDTERQMKALTHLREKFEHGAALEKALGQNFGAKLKFAKLTGALVPEAAGSIAILHSFRNEVHHIGVHHESILPELSAFYLKVACDYLGSFRDISLSWSSNQRMPERAKKYFSGDGMSLKAIDEYRAACASVGTNAGHDDAILIETLARHMFEVVENQDTCLDVVATGGPRPMSRDQAIIDCQTWHLAFSEEGRAFAAEKKFSGSLFAFVAWLGENYPLQVRRDPIASWRTAAGDLARETEPHKALEKYRRFMDRTAGLRERIEESCAQVEQYIDEQIDRMRGR
jgi:hypothetical protein